MRDEPKDPAGFHDPAHPETVGGVGGVGGEEHVEHVDVGDVLDVEDIELDALVRQAAAARSAAIDGHPDPAELAEYCLDALAPEEQEKIREHLPLCAACAQLVLDLKALGGAQPAGGPPEVVPAAALDDQWRLLAARLDPRQEPRQPRQPPQPREPGQPGQPRQSSRLAPPRPPGGRARSASWALAASLLVSLGLLAWGMNLRRDLDRALQPRADGALLDLAPLGEEGTVRSAEGPPQVPAAAGRRVVLELDLASSRRFPRYAMKLVAPGGAVVWQAAGVPRAKAGFFVLDIPRETLSLPGLYRVEIAGLAGAAAPQAAPTPLAAYTFLVPAAPSP